MPGRLSSQIPDTLGVVVSREMSDINDNHLPHVVGISPALVVAFPVFLEELGRPQIEKCG